MWKFLLFIEAGSVLTKKSCKHDFGNLSQIKLTGVTIDRNSDILKGVCGFFKTALYRVTHYICDKRSIKQAVPKTTKNLCPGALSFLYKAVG
jgi:hypothetical protein